MKKILLLLLFILYGCTKQVMEEDPSIYKDGSYTTIADGYGGDFEVTTTIENDEIVDIVVNDHNETPSIGGIAIESLIDAIKENNEQVDVISGATKTSTALIDAVNDALNSAKRDEY
ncbi:MAG: FMN-binding protein [Erysipelotrichaceae bacterium]|nr:FMN-binding protein [Erysipelotrichaceae bacterium]